MATKSERKPTKKQLLEELHERLGKCKALIADKQEPRQCTNWAINERGYCGTHYASAVERDVRDARERARKAELDARIDEYIANEPARQQATLDWAAEHGAQMTSLLEQMTKGIGGPAGVMERKAEKASKLTPVAGEAANTILPKDLPGMYMAGEKLAEAVAILRQAADAVEALIGQTAASDQPAQIETKKSKADERFAGTDPEPTEQSAFEARLKAQSEAAQAATFASLDAGADEEPAAPATTASGEWTCPTHGDKAIVTLKAKGRTIRACDKCDQVES